VGEFPLSAVRYVVGVGLAGAMEGVAEGGAGSGVGVEEGFESGAAGTDYGEVLLDG
jgi:hypothetical protein